VLSFNELHRYWLLLLSYLMAVALSLYHALFRINAFRKEGIVLTHIAFMIFYLSLGTPTSIRYHQLHLIA